MQKIRGFIHFENKSFEDVKSVFKTFELDSLHLGFFRSLERMSRKILEPGVFLSGEVKDSYSSKDIVNFFREEMSLKENLRGCDVSIESEDTIKPLIEGEISGKYIGIRIEPPYKIEDIYELGKRIGDLIEAHDILVRTVEKENNYPLVCIDLLTKDDFEKYKGKIEEHISSKGLKIKGYTLLSLE